MRLKNITYYVRVREHLIPVTVTTTVPASREWFLKLQHAANELVWGHEPEFMAQLAKTGIDMGIIEKGDLP